MLTLLTLRPATPASGYEDAGIISLAFSAAAGLRRLGSSFASAYWGAHRDSASIM